jgi:hypothetical protein
MGLTNPFVPTNLSPVDPGGFALNIQLAEIFSRSLQAKSPSPRASIVTVAYAGNWKALYPIIREKLPRVRLDLGARNPVVFGQDEAHYLRQMGPGGVVEFKQHVRQLLQDHDAISVFEAQRIHCLEANPECISDLVQPGRSAALYFRGAVGPRFLRFLQGRIDVIDLQSLSVSESSVSVVATRLSAGILNDEFDRVVDVVTVDERRALMDMRGELFDSIAPEIEDHFLERSFGVPKLRELARRKVVTALLKATVPPFSSKSGTDPIDYFKDELAAKFELHSLPLTYLNDVSPNLSFVIKTKKRSADLHRPDPPKKDFRPPTPRH